MLKTSSLAKWGVALLLLSSLSSCEDILEQYFPKPTPPPTIPTQPVAYTTYEIAGPGNSFQNSLLVFNPNTLTTTKQIPITGLSASSDRILGLDLRPATDQLYALVGTNVIPPFTRPFVTNGRLYTINPATGAATLVSPLSIPIQGFSEFGFDFNPVVDRIRIVSDKNQNLRVNPADGTAIEDGRINGGVTAFSGEVAYDNNMAGASSSNLYVIEAFTKKLYLQNPPNSGTLVEIGPLGINSGNVTFDIGGTSNKAYAVVLVGSTVESISTRLFSVNLTTGALTDLGALGFPTAARDAIAVPTGFTLGAGF
ncbi:hypothetical protein SAMN00120144_2575 [Hymenobacter roseosalivarius DSM 11622]|uniref:DUF4394 domain-containing protein n=1 Tax=Hymenobacter roseosalivarius DSM 11622 TaxID=645990 RepID=A0A1W1W3N3_9BACT|nr:DUF4394 domain-containing protein [Hymenobacter roseosalivarius]SMC00206.1 hypothetical protein SAMN00120144_2575 [Hymenobacter roseosalivarius DSM 11622]